MVSTLNELSHLKNTGFGQPHPPRHGLHLLYWFASDYIDFTYGEIVLKFRPQNGDFGFHMYQNRIEDDEPIVPTPNQNLTYYEVGNLNYRGANKLPPYVRANLIHNSDSNKDRIIVRLDEYGGLNRVYVTEHSDSKRFDSRKTHRVSQGLLQVIKNMTRDQFLNAVSTPRDQYISAGSNTREAPATLQSYYVPPASNTNDSWCAIL